MSQARHGPSFSNPTGRSPRHTLPAVRAALAVLVIASLACSTLPRLGNLPSPTPSVAVPTLPATQPPAPPTPTPQPLPPALVESDPSPGAEAALNAPIRLFFNQPMDRSAVESALTLPADVSGQVSWEDDATLRFTPDELLAPETELSFGLGTGALSTGGLALSEPLSLTFRTVGYLEVTQRLPEPGAQEVDPTSAVVASFNRPVTPLGADPADLPPAFSLAAGDGSQPQGRGEWVNTSTYVFYPQPSLNGGATYTVTLEAPLTGTDGSPLSPDTAGWSFTTALPRLLTIEPGQDRLDAPLDTPIVLTFNQPMDQASVQAAFRMAAPDASTVAGHGEWNPAGDVFTFTPASLLARNTTYTVTLDGSAASIGGTPLGAPFNSTFKTVPPLAVIGSNPAPGGQLEPFGQISLFLSAPITETGLDELVSLNPPQANPGVWWDPYENALRVSGLFTPNTVYSLTVSADLRDAWGEPLGQPYTAAFRTGPYHPSLVVGTGGESVFFLTPEDRGLPAQVTNLFSVPLSQAPVTLEEFMSLVGPDSWQNRENFRPPDATRWEPSLSIPSDQSQVVDLPVAPDGNGLAPGLYWLRTDIPVEGIYNGPYLLVVSHVGLTVKVSATEALVWAVDLRTGSVVPGAAVTLFDERGISLGSGQTDVDGVMQITIPTRTDLFSPITAVLGQPGEDLFSLALSGWNNSVNPWNFDLTPDYSPPHTWAYLYTDRPIYRPGDTVHFRAIVRQAYNGRYDLADLDSVPITVTGGLGTPLASFDLPLSAFGTAAGEYALPERAEPGVYTIQALDSTYQNTLTFQVAEYRKPEIDLQVSFDREAVQAGEGVNAAVNARYFFDAPAGNLPVKWTLYATAVDFSLSGYFVGVESTRWMDPFSIPSFDNPLGRQVAQGEAQTDPDGTLSLDLATEVTEERQRYTLELTAQDESGLPVSTRANFLANPGEFYAGLRPDTWVGQAGQALGFDVQVVDWQGSPAGIRSLQAVFQKVTWERNDPGPFAWGPTFTPQYTPVGSTDFSTSPEGQARLEFTPLEPGTYQLRVTGDGAATDLLLWVGGAGQAIWPNLPDSRLRLVPDRATYRPGETAGVFVPNPFGAPSLALVTVERATFVSRQVETIEAGGSTLSFLLSDDSAPNLYVSVTLLGRTPVGRPDFRQGYANLPVEPVAQTLQVSLMAAPERAGPGDEVTFDLLVADAQGAPVEGEFSLAVVDAAVLALADPNSADIRLAFYGQQQLGVQTGLSLAQYAYRQLLIRPGGGGGGGGDMGVGQVVRENFPDTAFWQAAITTGPDGRAQVRVPLPDTLTTWQVEVRGVGADTRVGSAQTQVVTSKDLLVRPVTPRFFTAGDRALLAAIVQNNGALPLAVEVSLQPSGFRLEDPQSAVQSVNVPANGRARVEWWGIVEPVDSVDLVFSARAAENPALQDSTRPAGGALPVLQYTAQQTFRTAGVLEEAGERLELVSLPRSFDPASGALTVELAPSLAAAMLDALEALESNPYDSTEAIVSRFLPNLETYRALSDFGIDAPELRSRLERALGEGLQALVARQRFDGGWSWWDDPGANYNGEASDPLVTAYAVLGLARAKAAGLQVGEYILTAGTDFLAQQLSEPEGLEGWQLDRQVFLRYARAEAAGTVDPALLVSYFDARSQMSPWSQALLALLIERNEPGSEAARTLLSDLQAAAIRSASGVHWEASAGGWQNMVSSLTNTAIVTYALAQRDPGSPLLADAVRYLMANRSVEGAWTSTYSTAWSLLALAEVMKGTGELGGDYSFSATLNGAPLAGGQAGGAGQITPVTASSTLSSLYPDMPNALILGRSAGQGRLYYTAGLEVNRPVEDAAPLSQGLSVAREYTLAGQDAGEAAPSISAAGAGERVTVRLALTLPHEAYHLLVEDFIPAGAEILDPSLKTSQQGAGGEPEAGPLYDPRHPFDSGWGWWLFNAPQVRDSSISWTADYLPAGSYELTYTLVLLQPGEYRVLPAHAWQLYFPEVQGNSGGAVFEITP